MSISDTGRGLTTQASDGSEVLLREYAIAALEGAHVIVIITTADFSGDTRALADRIQKTGLQIVLINGTDLKRVSDRQANLYDLIREQSRRTSRIKRGYSPDEVYRELEGMTLKLARDSEPEILRRIIEAAGVPVPVEEFPILLEAWRVMKRSAPEPAITKRKAKVLKEAVAIRAPSRLQVRAKRSPTRRRA